MKRTLIGLSIIGLLMAAVAFVAGPPLRAQDLSEKFAAVKANAAPNQKALRSYSWLEKSELSLKGEVKNTKSNYQKLAQ